MFDHKQFRGVIIQPVLKALEMYSQEAEDLLVGTCAQESMGGTYLIQSANESYDKEIKEGKLALGIYQMQPATHDDIWENYILKSDKLHSALINATLINSYNRDPEMLIYNLKYATAMTRIFYHRINEPIPKTLIGHATYYKKYWNTQLGKATEQEYIENYHRFTG